MKTHLHRAALRCRHSIILLLALCLNTLSAAAGDPLTVTGITSNAETGITLTFSSDVKVTHSLFGTKCYTTFTDKDAVPSTLNATPRVKGNVVVLESSYCTFVNGHHVSLTLNPECFTTLDGTTHLSGTTTFDFVMGDGAGTDPIVATLVAPSNGTVTRLGNIAVVFSPTIASIVEPAGFTIVNEHGHSLPILSVTIDSETSIKALNVNIDEGRAVLQPSTTYSLHIAPGALKCGSIVNDRELIYGKWYVRPLPLTLTTDPPANRMFPSVASIEVWAADGGALTLAPDLNPADITVSGIMDDNATTYAVGESIDYDALQQRYTIHLDRTITTATIAATTAINNSVKLHIPAGAFTRGATASEAYQALWIIKRPLPVGNVTWKFTPTPDSSLDALGTPITVEGLEGATTEQYVLQFSISGMNAYLGLNSTSGIRLVDALTGGAVMTFEGGSVVRQSPNNYLLILDHQILQGGAYTLVIPATCVDYYSDAEHYSPPQHPSSDITATWYVGGTSPTSVSAIQSVAPSRATIYDLQGRRMSAPATSGCYVRNGRKMIR